MDIRDIFRLTQGYRKKEKHYMDKEFEDKGNDDLEDLNNIIFTDTAEEAEQAEDIISSPAPAASCNTSGGASAQPDSARCV